MRVPAVISEEVRVGGVYCIYEEIYLCRKHKEKGNADHNAICGHFLLFVPILFLVKLKARSSAESKDGKGGAQTVRREDKV